MRSADLWRAAGLLALVAALPGCAMFERSSADQRPVLASAATPAPAARAAAAPAPAPAPAARGDGTPPPAPAVQQAFDSARLALNAGRNDEAERGFLALTRSNPELGGPHANLGIIYRRAGKLPEAVAEFEQAVKASPQQPVYFNQLGITYRQQGQFAKAREAYEKAIALDPNYAIPYLNLGILFDLYLWDSKRALALYDRYLALTPGGDERVGKWITDIKNRSQHQAAAGGKEQE